MCFSRFWPSASKARSVIIAPEVNVAGPLPVILICTATSRNPVFSVHWVGLAGSTSFSTAMVAVPPVNFRVCDVPSPGWDGADGAGVAEPATLIDAAVPAAAGLLLLEQPASARTTAAAAMVGVRRIRFPPGIDDRPGHGTGWQGLSYGACPDRC